jgi:hypothetical protein
MSRRVLGVAYTVELFLADQLPMPGSQPDRSSLRQHRKMFLHECTSIPTPGRRLKTCPSRFNRPLFDFVKQPKKSEFFRLGVAEMAHTLTMAANFLPSCLRPLTIGK